MVKRIDLNDWVLSGAGGVGVSYFHKTDPDIILKMDNREVSLEDVERSLAVARIAYGLGIPTPEPGEVVFDGQRYGQVFRRIRDKVSFARMCGEHQEMIPQLARDFAGVVKQLHSTKGTGTGLRSIKEVYGEMVRNNPFRPKELLDKTMDLLESLPDADTCLHGDLHFGNIIRADGKDYLIDISSFSYGHPYFDMAMMLATQRLAEINPALFFDLYHCPADQNINFWHIFNLEYFGEGVTDARVEEMVMPFFAVRMITMESESGQKIPPENIQAVIEYIEDWHQCD